MPTQHPIATVFRGDVEESKHYGHIAAVNHKGETLFSFGDPSRITFFRSTLKPFQAAIVVASGAYKEYRFTPKELALMAASHTAEPKHLECLKKILGKAKLPSSALYCGVSQHGLEGTTTLKSALHHECSGKHAGLSAAAKWMGVDWRHYHCLHHPVQEMIFESISHYCDWVPTEIGIDGCGLPTVAIPLEMMALGYARMANEFEKSPLGRVAAVMSKYPWFVGGTNKFDTEIMRLTHGEIIMKKGADGVSCLSIPSKKIGIAIKCEDGSSRPIPLVVITLLEKLGILNQQTARSLKTRHPQWHQMINSRNDVVGTLHTSF